MPAVIELIAKTTGSLPEDSVTLPYELRQRSRQRLTLDSGREAVLFLPPGSQLEDGDLLCTRSGYTVAVRAALETVSVARTGDGLQLGRACYHLGNRHVALQVGGGWLRYLPDHVLDEMVRGLGLSVTAERVPFEPERGAYAAATHTHAAQGGAHAARPHQHAHGHLGGSHE